MNVTLIGDDHSKDFWKYNYNRFIRYDPEYLLLETIGSHRYLNKQQRDSAKKTKVYIDDVNVKGYNSDAFRLADELDIPMIGIDVWNRVYSYPKKWDKLDKASDFEYSHKIRESNMVKILKKYENKGRILLIVGNEHLRMDSKLATYASAKNFKIRHFKFGNIIEGAVSNINLLVSLCLEELGPSNNFDNADSDGITQAELDCDPNQVKITRPDSKHRIFFKRINSPNHRANSDSDELQLDRNRTSV